MLPWNAKGKEWEINLAPSLLSATCVPNTVAEDIWHKVNRFLVQKSQNQTFKITPIQGNVIEAGLDALVGPREYI